MVFAESYLIDPAFFPELGKAEPWGTGEVVVNLIGGPYQFQGLDEKLALEISEHYSQCQSEVFNAFNGMRVKSLVCRHDSKMFKAVDFEGEVYTFDRSYREDHVRIAGQNFLAFIPIGSGRDGQLWVSEAAEKSVRLCIENFLRVRMAYEVLFFGGVVLHSGSVVIDGQVHLVLGSSGAGKSTFTGLGKEAGCGILSDDRNAVYRGTDGSWRVERMPFSGDIGQTHADGENYPLAGVWGLKQSSRNTIHPVSLGKALALTAGCAPVVNNDIHRLDRLLKICEDLVQAVHVGELEFALDGGIISLLQEL